MKKINRSRDHMYMQGQAITAVIFRANLWRTIISIPSENGSVAQGWKTAFRQETPTIPV
jgi:hypothetical protein